MLLFIDLPSTLTTMMLLSSMTKEITKICSKQNWVKKETRSTDIITTCIARSASSTTQVACPLYYRIVEDNDVYVYVPEK